MDGSPSIASPSIASLAIAETAIGREGVPCAFKGCAGFYHPAGGPLGVVLCAPWGFEDLTMRKGWRLLAEALAEEGFPTLRFDYPGTGDSLGAATDPTSADEWIGSVGAAADMLRKQSGVRGFVFLGQSLGALLALEAARGRRDVVSLQLVAPVSSGRAYVRELAMTGKMVAEKIGIDPEPLAGEGLSVVGFPLSTPMVESLKALDLTKAGDLHVRHATIWDQAHRKAGATAFEHLRRSRVAVVAEAIAPHHLMISDATTIQDLPVPAARIVAALRALRTGPVHPTLAIPSIAATMLGNGFREEPVRFGPGGALFGVLCEPFRPQTGAAAVILLNRGLNAHIGWRRVSVDHARGLAAAGISSLRLDVAGLGESRDEPGRPVDLIYSDLLLPDIGAAIDLLERRGHSRVALAGVCSGAYMALAAAIADPRVTDVLAVNPQRFVWNPSETATEVIRYGLRSMADYVGDIRSGGALRKLVRSRHRIVPAMRFLIAGKVKAALRRVPLGVRSSLLRDRQAARVSGAFDLLARRGTRISLLYSDGDPAMIELNTYFGPGGRDLRYQNVSVAVLAGADHNLTTSRASEEMLVAIVDLAGGRQSVPPRDASARVAAPAHLACPTSAG